MGSAGLQGCGINTDAAAPDTSFNLTFMVFDNNMPAASATFTKTITVISPCTPTQVFCRGMVPACGEGPCSLRQRSGEAAETDTDFAADVSRLPAGSVRTMPHGLEVMAVCSAPLPVVLPVCSQDDRAIGCLARAPPRTTVLQQLVSNCTLVDAGAGNCTLCSEAALQRRACAASVQNFAYVAANGRSLQNVSVTLTEAVGQVHTAFAADVSGLQQADVAAFMGYSAANGSLAAAMSSVAWAALPLHCGSSSAGAVVGAVEHTDVAVAVTVNQTAMPTWPSTQAALHFNATLTLGIALRGRDAEDVHDAVPRGAAHACLVALAQGALNATSLSQALATLQGAEQRTNVTAWQSRAATAAAGDLACTPPGEDAVQQLWLEASTKALAVDMQLLDIQVCTVLAAPPLLRVGINHVLAVAM